MPKTTTLLLDLEVGSSIRINGEAKITIERKTGRKTRIKVEAVESVKVQRLGNGQAAH